MSPIITQMKKIKAEIKNPKSASKIFKIYG